MKTSNARATIYQVWTDYPTAAVAAMLLGAALAAGVAIAAFWVLSAGDEPPIRVRNGSFNFEVVHGNRHWTPVGSNGTQWKLSKGARFSDQYQLYLAPTSPQSCGNVAAAKGKVVRFVLNNDDNLWVKVESRNKKTEVTSAMALTRSADKKVLSYGDQALFISAIQIDDKPRCSFNVKDTDFHAFLTE